MFAVAETQSCAIAIRCNGFDWKPIALGADEVAKKVRCVPLRSRRQPLERCHRHVRTVRPRVKLYGTLLGPVEALVKDKRSLLIVPSGALTALPFHLLVTEKPSAAIPEALAGDRDAAWLIRRQAVSVLPSVARLEALRAFARNNNAARPMTGFGDPLFDPAREGADKRATSAVKMAARSVSSAAYTDLRRGADVDRARLAAAPAPLPDTADELHAVARDLGASPSDIHLGADASATTLKRAARRLRDRLHPWSGGRRRQGHGKAVACAGHPERALRVRR
jgi:CHAT domain-containing protein